MTPRQWRTPVVGLLVAISGAVAAKADVVTLKNGSRLVGTVERLADGKLTLVTDFAGNLEIDTTMIESLDTDGTINMRLQSGDRLVGPIVADVPERATVQTAVGDVNVDVQMVEAIWPEGSPGPEEIAAQEKIDAARAKWKFTGEVGLTNQQGNTDSFDGNARLVLSRKTDKELLDFYFYGRYGEVSSVRNTAEAIGGIYYENNITRDFFWFVRNEAEYDEFESIDLRYTLTTGPGYYLIHKDDHELKTRAGIGFLHESYRDPPGGSEDRWQAEVGLDYFVDLTEWLRFGTNNTWWPTFDGINDYRLRSDNYVMLPLGTSDMWKLKLGALYQYNAMPQEGRENLDETYYANILLELKQK